MTRPMGKPAPIDVTPAEHKKLRELLVMHEQGQLPGYVDDVHLVMDLEERSFVETANILWDAGDSGEIKVIRVTLVGRKHIQHEDFLRREREKSR